ncbi:LacI family DNA-binding transcriptional regulator [Gordoniibacillus kamchatkensis]|uniref:LacI family DNA-binding transcriptional regulator n=1 Tax=Gordoniibacillus kamchatkensis TaxID=1590651 RepID=UPI00069822E5|nr:LacI family DNA-binding transcriptional regulator [Paenibacillus sp. VKM B-2647]
MSTIQDVAKYADVSIATVSRVLNNPEKVSEETRERVMEAVNKLNYFPNEKAKSLSSKNQNLSIGVIIPDITTFYFGELYKGISRTALRHKTHVLLHDLDNEGPQQQQILDTMVFLKQYRVDGIILASRFITEEYGDVIKRLKIPVVLVLGDHANAKIPAFKVDDIRASFEAVAYLVARGHKRIAMISASPDNMIVGQPRLAGYKNAIDYYQLPFLDQQVAYGNMRYDDGYSAMKELLSSREITKITAVFAATDEMAIGAMRCINDCGLKVPDDISVIGYDNLAVSNMAVPKINHGFATFLRISVPKL